MTETKPNPGSKEAVKLGCTCPVLDNGYGNDEIGKIRGFWITQNCPVHDNKLPPPHQRET